MTHLSDEPHIDVTSKANRHFIAQEGNDYACYHAVVRDQRGIDKHNAFSLKLSFDVSNAEAQQISRALQYVDYDMTSDVMGRFEVDLEGQANIAAGLKALFKRNSDGSLSSGKSVARPLVSTAMQNIIIEKLDGLLMRAETARNNLDDDQRVAAPALASYD